MACETIAVTLRFRSEGRSGFRRKAAGRIGIHDPLQGFRIVYRRGFGHGDQDLNAGAAYTKAETTEPLNPKSTITRHTILLTVCMHVVCIYIYIYICAYKEGKERERER